jgi:uncharacterized protein (UPF0276 family)
MPNRFGFPVLGFGMGLRPQHYEAIFSSWPKEVDWFEIMSENFMDTEGRPLRNLERILAHYPVVMHGVSLSIGSTDPLNRGYIKKLKALAELVKPAWVSDHLCWTGMHGKNSHDLLPMPYTKKALAHTVDRIKQVQDMLGRRILMENPSTYMEFRQSEIPEWEFIAQMAQKADCGLLLDANNVYVSCYNHRYDTKAYVDAIPMDRVVQIHLAGHDNLGTHIIDTHGGKVIDEVWNIYRYIISKTGDVATMVEWDDQIPAFGVVLEEVKKARKYAKNRRAPNDLPDFTEAPLPSKAPLKANDLKGMHADFQRAILSSNVVAAKPKSWVRPKKDFPEEAQLSVYVDGYRFRLFDIVDEDYPALRVYLGTKCMNALVDEYIEATPSQTYNIARYADGLQEFILKAKALRGKKVSRMAAREIAMLEHGLVEVVDLKETEAFDPASIADLGPEAFLKLKLSPRAALMLFAFTHDVHAFVSHALRGGKKKNLVKKNSYVAVFRDDDEVWRLPLEEEEYHLLSLLKTGKSLGSAIQAIARKSRMDEETLASKFQEWFGRWTAHHLLQRVA